MNVEILLFGVEEEGARAFAEEVGLPIFPVRRNDRGTPLFGSILAGGEENAQAETVCFVNSDIVTLPGFTRVLRAAKTAFDRFLLSAVRWDADVGRELEFGIGWARRLEGEVRAGAERHRPSGIDLFCYRGLRYAKAEPGFLYARSRFDNWMVWRALEAGVPFLDGRMMLVHQEHPRQARLYRDRQHPERVHNRRVYERETGGVRINFAQTCYHLEGGRWKRDHYGRTRGWEKV